MKERHYKLRSNVNTDGNTHSIVLPNRCYAWGTIGELNDHIENYEKYEREKSKFNQLISPESPINLGEPTDEKPESQHGVLESTSTSEDVTKDKKSLLSIRLSMLGW